MRISANDLREKNACMEQVEIFESEWPEGVEVTETSIRRAFALGLSIEWFTQKFLSPSRREEYKRQVAPFWEEYKRHVSPLWEEYKRQVAPFWEGYKRQVSPLWEEYKRQVAPFWEEYKRQVAPLLARFTC